MQQLNLFAESAPVLPITYYPDFLSLEQANELYQHCLKLEWQQNQIRMLGKTIPVPRLECIYGDAGCDYLYSNSVFLKPLTWTDNLANLRDRITALTGYKFRIVIGNQYRTGTDSIGWHADNEPSDLILQSLPLASVVFANSKSNRETANQRISGWNTAACS